MIEKDSCPKCGKEKPVGIYFCWNCWGKIPVKNAKEEIKLLRHTREE